MQPFYSRFRESSRSGQQRRLNDGFAMLFEKPVRMYLDQLHSEIVELQSYHPDADPFDTFKIFHKIVSRLIEHPTEPKYRRLRKSNEKVNKHLLRYQVAEELLRFIGFRVEFEMDDDVKLESEEVDTRDSVWIFHGSAGSESNKIFLLETVQGQALKMLDNMKRARQKPAEVILDAIRCAPAGLRFMLEPRKSDTRLPKSRPFLGIKNVGNVCYLNSMMQVLFFNSSFRRLIFSVARPDDGDVDQVKDDAKYIIYTLQEFFYALFSRRTLLPLDPTMLLKAFGWYGNQIYEQRDVSEFQMSFIDKIEEGLKGMPQYEQFKATFYGREGIRLFSDEVGYQSRKILPFSLITMQLSDVTTLEEALVGYIEGTQNVENTVEGHGRINCKQQWELHELPQTLHFHLQRFIYDQTTWQSTKIHDRVEFPLEIDMSPYVVDPEITEGALEYELYAVLVHSGTTNAGHYWAYVRCSVVEQGEERLVWYCMNDTQVEETDWETVQKYSYGGEDDDEDVPVTEPSEPSMDEFKKLMSLFGGDESFFGSMSGWETPNHQFASAYMLVYVAKGASRDVMSALETDYRLPLFHDLQTAIQKTESLRVSKYNDGVMVNKELRRRGLQPKQLCLCGKCLQKRKEMFT